MLQPDFSVFPSEDCTLLFPGPVGALECRFSPSKKSETTPRRAINAVICHPHPLFEGTMHNKVVSMLAKACFETGIDSVRFNFRGVGKSEGLHDNAVGETTDTIALAHWFKKIRSEESIVVLGFSFGACVAANAAFQLDAQALVMVAPPVERDIFKNIQVPDCPTLLLQGARDDIISFDALQQFAGALRARPTFQYQVFPDTGHFFHGQLLPLREAVIAFLKKIEPSV